MFISSENAQTIVKEMKTLLGYDINIMNASGIIIASTNPSRIGVLHEGAQQIIEHGMDELVIVSGSKLKNTLPGINFPILLGGKVVGVIGVTGIPADVMMPGNVIKRMTELMVESLRQKEDQLMYSTAKSQYIASWIASDGSDEKDLELRGHLLGVDINIPRIAMVFEAVDSINSGNAIESIGEIKKNILLSMINEEMDNEQLCHVSARRIVVLSPVKSKQETMKLISKLMGIISSFCESKVCVGVSATSSMGCRIGSCYKEAKSACEISKIPGNNPVTIFNCADPRIVAESIPQDIRRAMIHAVFANCSDTEKNAFLGLLRLYFRFNGNIGEAAEAMYVHRNTFQYRLRKIAEKTGYDINKTGDAFVLYLMCAWINA